MKENKNKNLKVFLLYLVTALIIFSPSLPGKFIFDDFSVLNNAEYIGTVKNYFFRFKKRKLPVKNKDSVAFWVFFLSEYKIFRDNPFFYKLVNLIFHVLSSFLFFLFLRNLLEAKFPEEDFTDKKREKRNKKGKKAKRKNGNELSYKEVFPFVASFLFLVHPVVCEAVSYVSGMINGIGGFFFIAGLYSFLFFLVKEGREKSIYLFLSVVFYLTAFFFKEVYLIIPLIYLLLYLFVKGANKKKLILIIVAFVFFVSLIFVLAFVVPISPFTIIKARLIRLHGKFLITALASNIYANLYSLFLNIFPYSLNIDHDLPLIKKIYDIRVLLSVAVIALLFYVFYRFRNKFRLSLFSLLAYFILMAPSNSFILRGAEWGGFDILSERNLYAPLFFFVIIITEFIWVLSENNGRKFKTISLILIFVFSVRTFVRNFDFRDNYSLWKSSYVFSSEKVRPNYNLAVELKNRGMYEEAIPYAEKAYRLYPSANTVGLLASLYKKSGQTGRYKDLLESALEKRKFQSALLFHELGEYYYKHGDFKKAEKYFLKAIKKDKFYILPRLSLVFLYLNEGEVQKVPKHLNFLIWVLEHRKGQYLKGVEIDSIVQSRIYFARALYRFLLGDSKRGVEFCKKSIELNPNFTEPYLKLGEYYYVKRKDDLALKYFNLAKKTPDYPKYAKQVEGMIEEIEKSKKSKKAPDS